MIKIVWDGGPIGVAPGARPDGKFNVVLQFHSSPDPTTTTTLEIHLPNESIEHFAESMVRCSQGEQPLPPKPSLTIPRLVPPPDIMGPDGNQG